MSDRKKENNRVCSSVNLPSNLVNNVFASAHYLGFIIKLLFFFTKNFKSFADFVSKSSEHCCGDFITRCWQSEEEWFWRFENFSTLKTAFCENWTPIKIKISMICVWKENEIKTKWYRNNDYSKKWRFYFFIWLNWQLVRENKNLVGSGWMKKFLVGGRARPSPH